VPAEGRVEDFERCFSDDSEVEPCTADGPEKVGILRPGGRDHAAVGDDHLGRLQRVEHQTAMALKWADTCTERSTHGTNALRGTSRFGTC